MEILGIDIGGSGIKGAPVDLKTGEFMTDRYRIPTPTPSVPDAVGDVVNEIATHFNWSGSIGCTFPAIVKNGVTLSAANVDESWIGANAREIFEEKTGCRVKVLNDADAAGIAEMTFGAGKGRDGVVIILTFGTGIGSAVFVDGTLMPNTEFGHIEMGNKIAEHRASDRVRKAKDWSWEKWSKRVNRYLNYLEFLFSPDLFIFGGGVSKKFDKFSHFLELSTEIVPASLLNDAGIVGAALSAQTLLEN